MQSAVLVLHLMVAVALIGIVLLQRSEGGALGIGGGGGGGGGFGGMMSARGATGGLVKITIVLAATFFATSIVLSLYGQGGRGSVLDTISIDQPAPGGSTAADIPLPLGNELGGGAATEPAPAPAVPPAPDEPSVPLSQ